MPAFLPQFNTSYDLWRLPNAPPAAPDQTNMSAQLYLTSRNLLDITPSFDDLWQPPVWLRVPIGRDIIRGDIVEVAPGEGWFYRVRWCERMHKGFTNEYFVAILEQTANGTIPTFGFVLLESGDHILLETGDSILLE